MTRKKSSRIKLAGADTLEHHAPLSETAAALACSVAPVSPGKDVKERLLARIRAERTTKPSPPGWRFTALDSAEGWVRLPFPGVRIREVTIDAERDVALLYVEMAAGANFPDHEHTAKERGLVLTGDLAMGDRWLRAGDYYEADAGTRHQRITSQSGCTGLLWVSGNAWQRWQEAFTRISK